MWCLSFDRIKKVKIFDFQYLIKNKILISINIFKMNLLLIYLLNKKNKIF